MMAFYIVLSAISCAGLAMSALGGSLPWAAYNCVFLAINLRAVWAHREKRQAAS